MMMLPFLEREVGVEAGVRFRGFEGAVFGGGWTEGGTFQMSQML